MRRVITRMQKGTLLNAEWWQSQKPRSLNVVLDLFSKK